MKAFILSGLALCLFSCTQKPVEDPNKESNIMLPEPTVIAKADSTSAEGSNEGLALIEGADCLACHKMDAKLVGPSYQEIANKYTEADVDKLADKIINGGQGNWGNVPMTAHAGMSKENAQKMVKYILTLKK